MAKEYIERETAIREACKGCNIEFDEQPCEPSDCYIRNKLLAIPAADVKEVVRCKDCKYFKYGDYCTEDKMAHSNCRENDFCSYGERKE